MRVSREGPCGDTTVTDAELQEAKRMFEHQLPMVTSGLSIIQQLAVETSKKTDGLGNVVAGKPLGIVRTIGNASCINERSIEQTSVPLGETSRNGGSLAMSNLKDKARLIGIPLEPLTTLSRRVVNSHLKYFQKFEAFRDGRFSKNTMYGFLFFTVVENRLRIGYAKRVLRNILSYARRYLAENGGDRLAVPIESSDTRWSTLHIQLTPESVIFLKENPRGTIVRTRLFYQIMNSVGNQTHNERLKNVVCEARRPRELVFSEEENATLLAFSIRALRVLVEKYVFRNVTRSSSATDAYRLEETVEHFVSLLPFGTMTEQQITKERTIFEVCVAFLMGFLTGARVKSTLTRLTVSEMNDLVRGKTLEKFTKGSFVRIFLPQQFTGYSENRVYDKHRFDSSHNASSVSEVSHGVNQNFNVGPQMLSVPTDHDTLARLLYDVIGLRYNVTLYPTIDGKKRDTFESECRSIRSCKRYLGSYLPTKDPVHDDTDHRLFFSNHGRQLDHAFDRVFSELFARPRPKGVFWHSQRRRYLRSVNEKYGAVTASKSVGHADVETTMLYINKSMHSDDTNRKAGSAIYEDTMQLIDVIRPKV